MFSRWIFFAIFFGLAGFIPVQRGMCENPGPGNPRPGEHFTRIRIIGVTPRIADRWNQPNDWVQSDLVSVKTGLSNNGLSSERQALAVKQPSELSTLVDFHEAIRLQERRVSHSDNTPEAKVSEQPWSVRMFQPILGSGTASARSVSLDDLIVSTLLNSKRIEVARLDSFIEQEKVTLADAQFDINAFTRNLFTRTNAPTSTTLEAGDDQLRLIQDDQTNQFGLRKKTRIGGNLEIQQNARFLTSNSEFLDPAQQGLTQLTLRYNQPLLRDGGRLVNEGQVILARIQAGTAESDAEAATVAILEELVQAYWDVYRLRGRFAVQTNLVDQIQQLLTDIQKRTRIDARPALVGQAEASLATQQAILGSTRIELAQAQLKLVRVVGDRTLANWHELIPVSRIPNFETKISAEAALGVAMTSRPEIRSAAQRIRSSELLSDISEQQLLPNLALLMESTVSGLGADYDVMQAFGDQFSRGGPGVVAGITYELPWGNRAARSQFRSAKLALAREVATFEDTVDQVRLDVALAVAALQGASSQYTNRVRSAKLTEDVVKSLLRRRQIFPAELDQISQLFVSEILDAQQRRAAAELEIVDLLAEYAITTLKLRKAMGTLLNFDQ